MTIEKMIGKDSVLLDLEVKNKKQLLEDLSKYIASIISKEEREIFNILLEREKLGTTGVGKGVAVPHGKLPKLERIHLLFAKTKKPIEYESEDGQSVDLFFLLLFFTLAFSVVQCELRFECIVIYYYLLILLLIII